MSERNETVPESPADVVRGLYDALAKGDVPGLLARLAPEVIVDEPGQLLTAACTGAGRRSCGRSSAR